MSGRYYPNNALSQEPDAFSRRIEIRLRELEKRVADNRKGIVHVRAPKREEREEVDEKGYCQAISRVDAVRYACAECGGHANGVLYPCSGCKQVHYCGVPCQKKAWNRVHSKVCRKQQMGFPSTDKLWYASFAELAIIMDEWSGCGTWLIGGIHDVIEADIENNGNLLSTAETKDIAYMADSIAKQLEIQHEKVAFWNLIFLAHALVIHTSSAGREAIQSTDLLSAVANRFYDIAPGFADCEATSSGGRQPKTIMHVKKFVVLTTQLLSGATQVTAETASLQECAELTLSAIMDCVLAIETAPDLKSGKFERSKRKDKVVMACQKAYVMELEKQDLRKELRRLMRKLTYRGFPPSDIHQVALAFTMDMNSCPEEKVAEALQAWATTTSNLSDKCGVDVTELKNAVRALAAKQFGAQLRFADE